MKRAILAAALAVSLPALAAPETYTLDPNHTFPSFEILHFNLSLQRGRFNKTSGKVTIDKEAKTGSVEVTIDAASIDTGLDKLEQHLRSDDFFGVGQFPTITYKGTKVNFDGDKVKSVEGELTMHGVTRPVTLSASSFNCITHPMTKKSTCGGEFLANIKRSEWGIGKPSQFLADDIALRINLEGAKD